jgi:hypothetical protein
MGKDKVYVSLILVDKGIVWIRVTSHRYNNENISTQPVPNELDWGSSF